MTNETFFALFALPLLLLFGWRAYKEHGELFGYLVRHWREL